MKRLRNIAAVLIFVFLLLVLASLQVQAAHAVSLQDLQQQARAASSLVAETEESLATAQDALERASEVLEETEAEIERTESRIGEIKEDISHNRENLTRQADFMYRSNNLGYIKMLFSANDLSDFLDTFRFVNMLAGNDAQTLDDLHNQNLQLEEAFSELDELRDQQVATEAARRTDVDSVQQLLDENRAAASAAEATAAAAARAEQQTATARQAAAPTAPQAAEEDQESAPESLPQVSADKHQQMIDMDARFPTLSRHERAYFIRYWLAYYQGRMGTSLPSGDKAVGISLFETGLGEAGVGRPHMKNLFGNKIDHNGRFHPNFPAYSNHRTSVKAIVVYYQMYPQGFSLWRNLSSSLGR